MKEGKSCLKMKEKNFLRGAVVKTLSSQCRGPGFNPWSGNFRSHMPQLKILHATTKTWHSQINK